MTNTEAKEIVRKYLQDYVIDEEYPLIWVGDIISENDNYITLHANVYHEGEDPSLDAYPPYTVDKHTGEVSLPGRVPIPDDMQ